MKKYVFVYIFVLFLLLSSCSNIVNPSQTEQLELPLQSISGHDAQNRYMLTNIISFQETDTFWCGSNFMGEYVHYYDKSSGISGVLCADPACSHDSVMCNAYMESGATLSFYDDYLYWMAKDEINGVDFCLWRSDLSGTNRKKIKSFSFEEFIALYQPQQYVIHRGMLYVMGRASSVAGTQSNLRCTLLSTPLDASEEFTLLYDQTFTSGVDYSVRFVGNYAYISVVTFPADGPFDATVIKSNLSDGVCETIYEETEMKTAPGAIWVTEQGTLYLPGTDERHAYVWRIENGKRVEIASWNGDDPSVPIIMDDIVVYLFLKDGVRLINVIDFNGENVYSGPLFSKDVPGFVGDPNEFSYALVGGDQNKIILNLQKFTETGLIDYTIMLDLKENLKPTILWSTQQ